MNNTSFINDSLALKRAGKTAPGLAVLMLLAWMIFLYPHNGYAAALSAAPPAPVAQYPSGTVGSATPTFRWSLLSGTTGYNLYIYTIANVKVFS